MCLPFYGPLVTHAGVPRLVGAGGVHEVDGTRVLVSRGIGMEWVRAPRARLFCRPQVLLVELVPGEPGTRKVPP